MTELAELAELLDDHLASDWRERHPHLIERIAEHRADVEPLRGDALDRVARLLSSRAS